MFSNRRSDKFFTPLLFIVIIYIGIQKSASQHAAWLGGIIPALAGIAAAIVATPICVAWGIVAYVFNI